MTTQQLSARQRLNVIASLRDQALDVRLGIITRDEWLRRIAVSGLTLEDIAR